MQTLRLILFPCAHQAFQVCDANEARSGSSRGILGTYTTPGSPALPCAINHIYEDSRGPGSPGSPAAMEELEIRIEPLSIE
jgi:hypothetical protein